MLVNPVPGRDDVMHRSLFYARCREREGERDVCEGKARRDEEGRGVKGGMGNM
jgi:hypothetical protein